MSRALTVDQIQEFSGLYDEEVGKIVDGLESGILACEFDTKKSVFLALGEIVSASDWACKRPWCIHTLLFSDHAMEVLQEYSELSLEFCAREALRLDCVKKLQAVEAYQKLATRP